jgi:hypothetical protein
MQRIRIQRPKLRRGGAPGVRSSARPARPSGPARKGGRPCRRPLTAGDENVMVATPWDAVASLLSNPRPPADPVAGKPANRPTVTRPVSTDKLVPGTVSLPRGARR